MWDKSDKIHFHTVKEVLNFDPKRIWNKSCDILVLSMDLYC